jgi:hypothetical protein
LSYDTKKKINFDYKLNTRIGIKYSKKKRSVYIYYENEKYLLLKDYDLPEYYLPCIKINNNNGGFEILPFDF